MDWYILHLYVFQNVSVVLLLLHLLVFREKCITLDSVKDLKQTIEDLNDKILIE